jgi:hypothetical protein
MVVVEADRVRDAEPRHEPRGRDRQQDVDEDRERDRDQEQRPQLPVERTVSDRQPDQDADQKRREPEQVVDGERAVQRAERGLHAFLVKEPERLLEADHAMSVRERLVGARDREAADDEVEPVDEPPERELERREPGEVEAREGPSTSGGGGGA